MTRILIVDDNAQNLYLLESILKPKQFEIVSARNGAEALDEAGKNPPDLIITDILMPVMDGFTLLRRWRADERFRNIPFIVYTATYTDPKDEAFALKLGADRFVLKPQKADALSRIVSETLEESGRKSPVPQQNAPGDEREILRQYNEVLFRKLEKKVMDLENEIGERHQAEEMTKLANRKLSLMTDVTSQDIQNKVFALRGYIALIQNHQHDEESSSSIGKVLEILDAIDSIIQRTKEYQQMGLGQLRWIPVDRIITLQMSLQSQKNKITSRCDLHGLEIYCDPLIDRVFYNLINNATRHGGKTSNISFSFREEPDRLILISEDDGVGIPLEEKPKIFDRIAGGKGKFGLFFVREFLTLSGMTITETGTPGRGARFEIAIPEGSFRFSGSA